MMISSSDTLQFPRHRWCRCQWREDEVGARFKTTRTLRQSSYHSPGRRKDRPICYQYQAEHWRSDHQGLYCLAMAHSISDEQQEASLHVLAVPSNSCSLAAALSRHSGCQVNVPIQHSQSPASLGLGASDWRKRFLAGQERQARNSTLHLPSEYPNASIPVCPGKR